MSSTSDQTVSAVIVAAGSGLRFGGVLPKQLAPLAGRPVLTHTLAAFAASPLITEIVLVLPADWLSIIMDEAVRPFGLDRVIAIPGGATRTASTRAGFEASRGSLVLIHDGVRPLVERGLIEAVAEAAKAHGAALAAVPVRDTLKIVEDGLASATVDRARLWQAQTPQGFQRDLLRAALDAAGADEATDDIGLVERLGRTARVVESSPRNLKITAPEDLAMAEALLKTTGAIPRTGHGYDVHRLTPGRPLFLGCVEVPFEQGLLGHSDADVLAHALVDALMGAAGLGDIGLHFPDRDPQWAGASGASFLTATMALVRAAGYELVNADLTLVGEKPKIGPHRQAMREAVAAALGVAPGLINIKATTTEGTDAVGQGLALAAYATATIN